MLRDLLSSRWFQGGFAFFVLCVSGSLLYSWHVHRTTEAEFGKRPQPGGAIKNKSSTNTAPVDFQTEGVTNTPEETTDTPMSDETEADTIDETEFADMADAFLPDDVGTEETPAEEVAVSPFGFGPYPEVPEAYREKIGPPSWEWPEEIQQRQTPTRRRRFELMGRVLIKLWNNGDREFTGATTGHGKIYPTYPRTAYVRYTQKEGPDGSFRISGSIRAGSDFPKMSQEQLEKGEFPAGFHILDESSEGIDPFEFLDLNN
ncbi:MAG: hypothetical protein OXU51_13780 [Candidatus Poribacteria bacterium]|nr:hypothetical protein [Candidatus Poribacteria bacterium]